MRALSAGDCIEFRYAQGSRRGEVRRFRIEQIYHNGYKGFDFTIGEVRKYLSKYMSDVVVLHKVSLNDLQARILINNSVTTLEQMMKVLQTLIPDDSFVLDDGSNKIVRHFKKPVVMVDKWYVTVEGTTVYFQKFDDGSVRLERPYEGRDQRILDIIRITLKEPA